MEFKIAFARWNLTRVFNKHIVGVYYSTIKQAFSQNSTDAYLENLVLEEASKRENILLKYFENRSCKTIFPPSSSEFSEPKLANNSLLLKNNIEDLIRYIESTIKDEGNVPNNKLNYLLVYFSKTGHINGVKAVQFIVKKNNISHFKLHSCYKHYVAEALWINGKIEESLKLFLVAYDNSEIKPKVKVMLKCLFPLLITHHGKGTLLKTVYAIQKLSVEKQDFILLACLWKELFQSTWFSDQQLAKEILEKNVQLLTVIQWMIPAIAKELLKNHRIDDFYRLLEMTLENSLKSNGTILIQLLFNYYYIQENIERCSAVVKYSTNVDASLTDEQLKQYIDLLLKSKNSASSKLLVKNQQNLQFKF